jgi:hypothetical protein
MINEPVSPLARSPALKVKFIQLKDQAEARKPVNQIGSVSFIVVPLAISGHELP